MRDLWFQPLTWGWLMLGWLGIRAWRQGRRGEGGVALGLFVALMIAGGTPAAGWLLGRMERPYARSAGVLPAPADVVVMLGGGHSASHWEVAGLDANVAFDRALAAGWLLRAGVATNLILGGGPSPTATGMVSDGQRLAEWLRQMGETRATIRVLPACATTADEARETAKLVREQGWRRVILISSAAHLPRAVGAFRRAGVEVEPFGADFRGLEVLEQGRDWSLVPSAGTLMTTQHLIHELVGGVWYWWRAKGG